MAKFTVELAWVPRDPLLPKQSHGPLAVKADDFFDAAMRAFELAFGQPLYWKGCDTEIEEFREFITTRDFCRTDTSYGVVECEGRGAYTFAVWSDEVEFVDDVEEEDEEGEDLDGEGF